MILHSIQFKGFKDMSNLNKGKGTITTIQTPFKMDRIHNYRNQISSNPIT